MRLFLAHNVQEDIAEYHRGLQDDLFSRFKVPLLYDRIPPHITLKAPFEVSDEVLDKLVDSLHVFARDEVASRYALPAFGYFKRHVIYLGVDPSARMIETAGALLELLAKHPGISFSRTENDYRTFHSTVAKQNVQVQFDQLWKYCSGLELPSFSGRFDSISLMRYVENTWEVVEEIALGKGAQ